MFASSVCVPVGITSSAVRINIFAITAVIKKYKSIINKNMKKHYKIVFLGKDKLNTVEVLISKAFCEIYYTKTMETYCVSCIKYTAGRDSNVREIKQNRLMLLSNGAVCGKKNSTFIKSKELYNFY